MHATLIKFGYPGTAIFESGHWVVSLRHQQITLGSLVLIAKSEATSFSALPPGAYSELENVTRTIEHGLRAFRPFDRINYVMLMMVDPHVHFHVLPRYRSPQTYGGSMFSDAGWPGPPDFKAASAPSDEVANSLTSDLIEAFLGVH